MKHNLRILVTNDDGVRAEGIAHLEAIARELSDDVWVVAPATEQSGVGHGLSLHDPIRFKKLDERRYEVQGTPTDSVLMGVMEIIADKPVDLVLSGINRGCNIADDVTYSGTIAAAMEGTILEIPSIALSQYTQMGEESRWDIPRAYAAGIIRQLMEYGWPTHNLVNINFPHVTLDEVKGVKLCPMGIRKIGKKTSKQTDPMGRDYYWIGGPNASPSEKPGTDDRLLNKGYITVTPICMDMTNYRALEQLREQFEAAEED